MTIETALLGMDILSLNGYEMPHSFFIEMTAVRNCREMGGQTNRDGALIPKGLLFRSGHLAERTHADSKILHDLGIKTVIDFRGEPEKARHPVAWDDQWRPTYVPIPIGGNAAAWIHSLMEEIASSDFPATALNNQFIKAFQTIPIANASGMAQFFRTLIDAEPGGILFHCTAGKDRTGIAAALLMEILGFTRGTITAHFMATNDAIDLPTALEKMAEIVSRKTGVTVNPPDVLPMVGVKESYLDALFDTVAASEDAFEEYRQSALGLNEDDIQRLRAKFLTVA